VFKEHSSKSNTTLTFIAREPAGYGGGCADVVRGGKL